MYSGAIKAILKFHFHACVVTFKTFEYEYVGGKV